MWPSRNSNKTRACLTFSGRSLPARIRPCRRLSRSSSWRALHPFRAACSGASICGKVAPREVDAASVAKRNGKKRFVCATCNTKKTRPFSNNRYSNYRRKTASSKARSTGAASCTTRSWKPWVIRATPASRSCRRSTTASMTNWNSAGTSCNFPNCRCAVWKKTTKSRARCK